MTQLDAPDQTASPEEERGIGFALVNEVRGLLNADRRGDLAELRGLDPAAPQAPAFFRILARVSPEAGVESMRRYAHYLRILALNPEALSNERLGDVMAASGLSENRVQRLLTARGESLHDQLRLVARRLANAGNVPWSGFRDLLLTTDEDKVERKRMIIARDYWRALDRQQAQS